ncbi:universal stress protein [Sphingosinicellaceae bacterium]|nr:universal stress protein [Sphingosinicellaceae bacterium]
MKNILLLVHDDDGQEARLQVALDLARALDGHITCVDVVQMIYAPDGLYGGSDNTLLVDEMARETANHAALAARFANEAVSWNWLDRLGDLAGCVTRAAGLADIIVVNRALEHDPLDMAAIAASVAIATHKPVVAVADTVRRFDTGGAVLVAWDGSLSAMAALSGTLPLLKLAGSVHILEIDIAADAAPAEEAAEYLSRHGIHAEIVRVPANGEHADAIIRRKALDYHASYCVMGAYGHSRVGEALFGGVTRRMLKACETPLVIVH